MTKYIYSATGEKLRTIYQTAVPNITVAMGSKHELTDAEVLYKDSVDYYHGGKLTVKNGRLDKCYFDGGYAQASPVGVAINCKPAFGIFKDLEEEDIFIVDDDGNVIEVETVQPSQSSSQQSSNFPLHDPISKSDEDVFTFHYYTADHLGNIREVINEDGAVEQITNYYPFGTPFAAEAGNTNPDQQNHKYNGKEFDTMHGLNTYDYGARQYSSLVGRWDRMDPLCEKYYSVSPYAYCANNPVKNIDSDGKEVIDMLPAQSKGQETSKNNFFNQWHDNANSIILMGHGIDNGKKFRTQDNPSIIIYADSPYSMTVFLEDNSKTWNIHSIASDRVELVLFSCDTGAHDGLAENLSKQNDFQDISIFAPTEPVNINPDGSVSIDNNGVWREYLNGEIVNEYSGNTVPGTQEFNSSTFWEKIPQYQYWIK